MAAPRRLAGGDTENIGRRAFVVSAADGIEAFADGEGDDLVGGPGQPGTETEAAALRIVDFDRRRLAGAPFGLFIAKITPQ